MDTALKSQNRQAFWKSHIEAWSKSGLNQTDYCKANDLSPQQFSSWKHKLLPPVQGPSSRTTKKAAGFAQAYQSISSQDASGLSITLPNGSVIHGINQNNLTTVAQLIRAL